MCVYEPKNSGHLYARHNIQRIEAISKHYSGLISGVLGLNTLEGFWSLPLSSFFLASPGSTWTSWRMRGRLVTIPVPRGSRSLPTRLSSTELLPLLWRHKQHMVSRVRWGTNQGLHILSHQIQQSPHVEPCWIRSGATANTANCTCLFLKQWPGLCGWLLK